MVMLSIFLNLLTAPSQKKNTSYPLWIPDNDVFPIGIVKKTSPTKHIQDYSPPLLTNLKIEAMYCAHWTPSPPALKKG